MNYNGRDFVLCKFSIKLSAIDFCIYVYDVVFLQADDHLEKYMDTFDIVMIDDQTMDVPNRILTLIADSEVGERAAQ